MVDSGKSYGGHKLFRTSAPGLYYTLAISDIWSTYAYTDISPSGMYIGDSTSQSFNWRDESEQILYQSYDNANTKNKYWIVGGVMQTLAIEFYADTNFSPAMSQRVTLSGIDNYLYSFKVYGAGIGISGYSYFLKMDFNLADIVLTNSTCFIAALNDSLVGDSIAKMDDHTPAQIKNSVTAVPLDIALQNCIHIRNIGAGLKSNKVDSVSKEPLVNALTGNDVAKGVGVLIEDLKDIKNA